MFLFPVGGGSKKFEDWRGLKNFRTRGVTDLRGGGQYSITCHVQWKIDMMSNTETECVCSCTRDSSFSDMCPSEVGSEN